MTVRNLSLLLAVLGGVVSLYLSGQVWVAGLAIDPVLGAQRIQVSGADATPASALSLVILAGLASGLLTSGWGHRVAVAITALAGLGVAGSALVVILDPASALRSGIAGTLSINGPIESASLGWAVWAALVTGLLVTSAVVVRAIATPALRAESASEAAREHTATDLAEAERRRQVSAWDDLSRGDDPTQSGS